MSFGFIAFHYPAPEHVEEFVGSCHQVAEAARRQPGFLCRELGATPDGLSDLEVKPRQVHFVLSR